MLALILFLALFGLVVGALARLALPGPDPMGISPRSGSASPAPSSGA